MADRVPRTKRSSQSGTQCVTKYIPDEKGEMRAVRLVATFQTNEERELPVALRLRCHRARSNTKAYQGKLETDPDGYLIGAITCRKVSSRRFHIAGAVADRVYSSCDGGRVPAAPRRWKRRNNLGTWKNKSAISQLDRIYKINRMCDASRL